MKAELESLIEQMIARGILFEEAVQAFEKQFILNVVNRHNRNLSKAADELGIHRHTLSKRLLEYQNGANHNGHVRHQLAARRKATAKSANSSAPK